MLSNELPFFITGFWFRILIQKWPDSELKCGHAHS